MNIAAIFITYNSDAGLLLKSVSSLAPQVRALLIVDNGSDCFPCFPLAGNMRTVFLGENMGIAAATNIGLRILAGEGYDWIITSDQDTVYPSDYVPTFSRLLSSFPSDRSAVAAFTPVFFDENLGEPVPVSVRSEFGTRKVYPDAPFTKVLQAIAIVVMQLLFSHFAAKSKFVQTGDTTYCLKSVNTHDCGFVNVQAQEFIDSVVYGHCFIIVPSCSEGMCTSVATCMAHGIIPIVTSTSVMK